MEPLSHAFKSRNFVNRHHEKNSGKLSTLKIYQVLSSLGYGNLLFISSISLMNRRKEIIKLWPCTWSSVLVVNYQKRSDKGQCW
jgi:hypothetical protein